MEGPVLIASDHAGLPLRLRAFLEKRGVSVLDLGTNSGTSVDYPDYAHKVAGAVSRGEAPRGILVCGSGLGMVMAANRHKGVRAALPYDEETARLSRAHNDSNVLALGSRTLDHALAERIVVIWLETPFEGGRHAERVAKIEE
jgi:ribose 5-phosphate isomerase B